MNTITSSRSLRLGRKDKTLVKWAEAGGKGNKFGENPEENMGYGQMDWLPHVYRVGAKFELISSALKVLRMVLHNRQKLFGMFKNA